MVKFKIKVDPEVKVRSHLRSWIELGVKSDIIDSGAQCHHSGVFLDSSITIRSEGIDEKRY